MSLQTSRVGNLQPDPCFHKTSIYIIYDEYILMILHKEGEDVIHQKSCNVSGLNPRTSSL